MNKEYKLTLEETYCKDWTVQDAIRELLQNALDTHTNVEVEQDTYKHNLWVIRDSGGGMKLGDFLIGRTTKSDDKTTIGQFGEGASLACLVLAREGRFIDICSGDYRYDIKFSRDEDWDATLLTFAVSKLPVPISGTIIRLETTTDEVEASKSLFTYFNPQEILHEEVVDGNTVNLLSCKGEIYVNGLKVSTIKSYYGYDFHNHKDLMNRDRNIVGHAQINTAIEHVLEQTTNPVLIKELLRNGTCLSGGSIDSSIAELAEFRTYFYPTQTTTVWKDTINDLYGPDVCLQNHPHSDLLAVDSGWTVLHAEPGFMFGLSSLLDKSDKVELHPNTLLDYNELSEEDQKALDESKAIVLEFAPVLGIDLFPVVLFKSSSTNDFTDGEFKDGKVFINIRVIQEHDITNIVSILTHECVHGSFKVEDLSRAFEDRLTTIIGKLVMLLKEKVS